MRHKDVVAYVNNVRRRRFRLRMETGDIVSRMDVTPTRERQELIDATVSALVDAGIFYKLDRCYFLAAHDDQAGRQNWCPPYSTMSKTGTLTFTADRGFQGDGTTGRMAMGATPTGLDNYKQNDASLWVWSLTDSAQASADIGRISGGGVRADINCRNGSGNTVFTLNDATGSASAQANSLGMVGVTRRPGTPTVKRLWKNGASVVDVTVASTGLPNVQLWACGSSSTNFSARQIAFAAFGASLEGKEQAFYEIVRDYLLAVGAVS